MVLYQPSIDDDLDDDAHETVALFAMKTRHGLLVVVVVVVVVVAGSSTKIRSVFMARRASHSSHLTWNISESARARRSLNQGLVYSINDTEFHYWKKY